MTGTKWGLRCNLYAGAFSGEVVFAFKALSGDRYEGIAPRHYAAPMHGLSRTDPTEGAIQVRLIRNGGKSARVAVPDGESVEVPANLVTEMGV